MHLLITLIVHFHTNKASVKHVKLPVDFFFLLTHNINVCIWSVIFCLLHVYQYTWITGCSLYSYCVRYIYTVYCRLRGTGTISVFCLLVCCYRCAVWRPLDVFSSPRLFQLSERVLHCCFAVKLQKCFVDDKTSPGFPLAGGWTDNDWIFISGFTVPLRIYTEVLAKRKKYLKY